MTDLGVRMERIRGALRTRVGAEVHRGAAAAAPGALRPGEARVTGADG